MNAPIPPTSTAWRRAVSDWDSLDAIELGESFRTGFAEARVRRMVQPLHDADRADRAPVLRRTDSCSVERVAEAHAAPDEIELDIVASVHSVDDRVADAEIEHDVAGVLDDVAG